VQIGHGALTADGYGGRDLEVLLTRLIFCFFGDDTGIFGENTQIHRLLLNSAEDGSDLGSTLSKLRNVSLTRSGGSQGVCT
jgi:hypothetical protein